ncbi:hypothetical protein LMG28727_01334 [Paraburkholderia kirstenboschensis]|uniref:hypothetical protein n=1 Tax=Paraburkholderia kirstenboschensis TaxID=1245436 RepID=UPI000A4A82C3|nr:hypothetical protein [Paraburkholderia kirstenboschensis]CAD6516484.1 hypothetical protein LMG28727_01334 [Paraburkholderia kirstenboschensis]
MKNAKRPVAFVMLTPVFFILSLWVSAFPHEYAHSIIAWLFGYKPNPFDIDYRSFDWKNVLLLENNDLFWISMSILFGMLTPIVVIVFWPGRDWAKERERAYLAY